VCQVKKANSMAQPVKDFEYYDVVSFDYTKSKLYLDCRGSLQSLDWTSVLD